MGAQNNQQAHGAMRRWVDRLLAWVERLVQPLMNPARVLWLTGWCTVLILVGAVFFLVNDQGLDFLRRMVEGRGWHGFVANFFFFLGVLALGLATWYCARLLLTRRFPLTDQAFFDETRGLRTWLPRVEGSLVPLIVAAGFFRVALWRGAGWVPYGLVALYLVVAVVLFTVVAKRRKIVAAMRAAPAPDQALESLPNGSWRVVAASLVLSWGLLILLLIFPVGLPQLLGAPAVLMLAAASWVVFGSMIITYWPLVNRYPSLTLPLILAALVMSWWNDNHTIRSTEVTAAGAQRERPGEHFRNWLNTHMGEASSDRPYPVFVVAAAGGGIRAAYWTASVLGRIADESGGAWPDHLYAMSGVSGGSVGSALHAVQIADVVSAPQASSGNAPAVYVTDAQHSLENDLLSPVLSYLLFPDLVQRFVPYPFSFADRARALELALESAAADPAGANTDRFARRFVELWPEAAPYRVPVLLLNTTVVETGQRAIVSNLQIDNTFSDTVDLLAGDKRTQDMPLSTAAHLSARFTYVSPAGTIRTPQGGVWGHIVDGGYFENSGAATAVELLQRMRAVADTVEQERQTQKRPRKIALMLILIRNDPEAPGVCDPEARKNLPPKAYTDLNDLLSPIRALLSTRTARGRLAEENALDLVRAFHRGTDNVQSPHCQDGCVFELSLGGGDIDPPLGWSLSARARELMDVHLSGQQTQFACIKGLLTGTGCEQVPVCPAR